MRALPQMNREEAIVRAREQVGEERANELGFALRPPPSPDAAPDPVCSIDVGANTAAHTVAAGRTWEEALEKLGEALANGSLDRALDAARQESRMADEGGSVAPAEPPRPG